MNERSRSPLAAVLIAWALATSANGADVRVGANRELLVLVAEESSCE